MEMEATGEISLVSQSFLSFLYNEDAMMTAEASNEADLDRWRKSPYVTVDEAMNLILGVVPGTYRFDYIEEASMPPEAVPIYRKLIHDIRKFQIYLCYNGIKITDELSLNRANVVSHDEYLHSCWWHHGKILTDDLRKWLQRNGFPSTFFESKPTKIPDYLNSDLEEHSYKLAAAVKAWEHFYTRGLTNRKKSLKQNIEAWLTEHAKSLNLLYNKKVSKQMIEDIAKIVNWKPEGGAPKS